MNAPTLFDALPLAPRPNCMDIGYQPPELKLSLSIDGEPVAKGRPRVRIMTIKGKAVPQLYAPRETEEYETHIKQHTRRTLSAMDYMQSKFFPYDDKPLGLVVRVFVPIPASWSQKQKAAALRGEIYPLSRPDADNYLKMVCDALNTIIYRDDSLVTDKHVIKRYSETPRLEIEVWA